MIHTFVSHHKIMSSLFSGKSSRTVSVSPTVITTIWSKSEIAQNADVSNNTETDTYSKWPYRGNNKNKQGIMTQLHLRNWLMMWPNFL